MMGFWSDLLSAGMQQREHSDEDYRQIALSKVGVPFLSTVIGDPPFTCDAADAVIAERRAWAEKLPDLYWRKAYLYWIEYAEERARGSRAAWAQRERRRAIGENAPDPRRAALSPSQ